MEEKFKFTTEELAELQRIATHLKTTMVDTLEPDDENYLRQQLEKEISDNKGCIRTEPYIAEFSDCRVGAVRNRYEARVCSGYTSIQQHHQRHSDSGGG